MSEIVAEISGNHGGSLDNAIRLIRAAKECGADAVKFQCFEPEQLACKRSGVTWEGKRLLCSDLVVLYRQTHTPKKWFPTLVVLCNQLEIPWFSSVFHRDDVAFLERMGCPRYKISAYETLDGDLINAVVATRKPVIISVRPRPGLTILHATDYEGNLKLLGISDHSGSGIRQPCPMMERHLCLPDVETPDRSFSSTPLEFADYVKAIRAKEYG